MEAALTKHRQRSQANPILPNSVRKKWGLTPFLQGSVPISSERSKQSIRTVEEYSAARRLSSNACIHCHQVYEVQREALQAKGEWQRDKLWVYPLPENVGLTLELHAGDCVRAVATDSVAARAGLQEGDRLVTLNGVPVASLGDVQYALHRAPAVGTVAVRWSRGGTIQAGALQLPTGWRETDISWRWSLRGLEPSPWVHGTDLTPKEKHLFGLGERQLAFSEGNFLSTPARQAGIQQNDIIVGVDDKHLELTARQFQAYVRLNYKIGDRVTYNIIRDGKRLNVPLTLIARPRS
jgi:S1-C subfamily serine protease